MQAVTAGLEDHADTIIKLLKTIEDPKTKAQKTGATIAYILDEAFDSGIEVLGIIEALKIALFSHLIIQIGTERIAWEAAAKHE
jgi:phosphosulfolactate synthase (CoM biosynthesis protein A)